MAHRAVSILVCADKTELNHWPHRLLFHKLELTGRGYSPYRATSMNAHGNRHRTRLAIACTVVAFHRKVSG